MIPHVHNKSTLSWGYGRIGSHLSTDHGMAIPMAWTFGQMHEAHLKAHQTPEEKPMTLCGHQCPDYPTTCTYEVGHDSLVDPADRSDTVIYGKFDHGNEAEGMWWTERVNRPENRDILWDRIIAAMAGVDFDLGWAADNGIGQRARGAFRQSYGQAADRLLTWLERGGASYLPSVSRMLIETETAQRLQRAAESDRDKTAEDLAHERSIRSELEEVNENLVSRSQHAQSQWATANDQLEECRQRLDTAVVTRDRAMEAGRILERERDVAQDALHRLQGQWDRVVPHLESRLVARTNALTAGQTALRALIGGLNQGMVPLISEYIVRQLEAILAGQGSEVASACTEPHLGLATTGELLDEIRTRIDLGHCGLGYRTVDSE